MEKEFKDNRYFEELNPREHRGHLTEDQKVKGRIGKGYSEEV